MKTTNPVRVPAVYPAPQFHADNMPMTPAPIPAWLEDHIAPARPSNVYEVMRCEVRARDIDHLLDRLTTPFTFTGTVKATGAMYSRHMVPTPSSRMQLGLVAGDTLMLTYTNGSNPEFITVI